MVWIRMDFEVVETGFCLGEGDIVFLRKKGFLLSLLNIISAENRDMDVRQVRAGALGRRLGRLRRSSGGRCGLG